MNRLNYKQILLFGILCGIFVSEIIYFINIDGGIGHLIIMGITAIIMFLFFSFRAKKLMTFERTDIKHLRWIYNRLRYIHNEDERYDYMIRLKCIIDKIEDGKIDK